MYSSEISYLTLLRTKKQKYDSTQQKDYVLEQQMGQLEGKKDGGKGGVYQNAKRNKCKQTRSDEKFN